MQVMDRFRGRVALVTGASAGIGESISGKLCVELGMKVVGCARRIDKLKDMEAKLEGKTINAMVIMNTFNQSCTLKFNQSCTLIFNQSCTLIFPIHKTD
jgi:NADP-dependent 3-hydroxy acid dehydrogenase YdfG